MQTADTPARRNSTEGLLSTKRTFVLQVSWMVNVVIVGCPMTPAMKATLRARKNNMRPLISSMVFNFCDWLFVHPSTWRNGCLSALCDSGARSSEGEKRKLEAFKMVPEISFRKVFLGYLLVHILLNLLGRWRQRQQRQRKQRR